MLYLLVLIVVGAVAAAALGLGALGRGAGISVAVGAGAFALVVLAAVVLFGAGALRGGPGDETPSPEAARPTLRREPAPLALPPASRIQAWPESLRLLLVPASEAGQFPPHNVAGMLQPDSVVRVRASGFEPFEVGTVEQCVTEPGRLTSCTPEFPVQFGEGGTAEFQYQLRASFAPGQCRSGRATCELRVRGRASGREGGLHTVFVDRAPDGHLTVEPRTGLADGNVVSVSVRGFPADVAATVMLCAPPATSDARRCTSLAGSTFMVGRDGSGTVAVAVRTGPLGADRARCGPRAPCGLSVVTEHGFVAAPVVPLRFSLGPGASYDPGRLAIGLSLAAVLLAVAVVLVRRTDWTKPSEAATPEVDATDLQADATLDDLFGTDEELERSHPVQL